MNKLRVATNTMFSAQPSFFAVMNHQMTSSIVPILAPTFIFLRSWLEPFNSRPKLAVDSLIAIRNPFSARTTLNDLHGIRPILIAA